MTDLTGTWLRPPAAARYLGISASTLAKWRLRGFGPRWTKLSKAVAYDRSTLEEFARSNLRSSTSEIAPERATGHRYTVAAADPEQHQRIRSEVRSNGGQGLASAAPVLGGEGRTTAGALRRHAPGRPVRK